jgi:hypothetical protein
MKNPSILLKEELEQELLKLKADYKVVSHRIIKDKILLLIEYNKSRLARIS